MRPGPLLPSPMRLAQPEQMLRAVLYARGVRFRKNKRVCAGDRWVRPDGPSPVASIVRRLACPGLKPDTVIQPLHGEAHHEHP